LIIVISILIISIILVLLLLVVIIAVITVVIIVVTLLLFKLLVRRCWSEIIVSMCKSTAFAACALSLRPKMAHSRLEKIRS